MNILIALGIPFIGTTLGAAMVFFMKEKIAPKLEKALLGFASGVMIAASVWSLLIPSIDMTEAQGGIAWVPAVVGFLLGIAFLLLLDALDDFRCKLRYDTRILRISLEETSISRITQNVDIWSEQEMHAIDTTL